MLTVKDKIKQQFCHRTTININVWRIIQEDNENVNAFQYLNENRNNRKWKFID